MMVVFVKPFFRTLHSLLILRRGYTTNNREETFMLGSKASNHDRIKHRIKSFRRSRKEDLYPVTFPCLHKDSTKWRWICPFCTYPDSFLNGICFVGQMRRVDRRRRTRWPVQ